MSANTTSAERSADLVRVLVAIVVFGLFLAAAESYRHGYYLGQGFPANTFLFSPGDHFADLRNALGGIENGHPNIMPVGVTVYLPFLGVVGLPYTLLSLDVAVGLLIAPLLAVLAVFIYRQLDFLRPIERWWATAALSTLSYPLLFLVDRANTEAWVIIAIAAFLLAFLNGHRKLAAVALGFAIALKGVPAVFLLMFLVRRQWREVAIALGTTVILTLLGILVFGVETIDEFRKAANYYQETYAIGDAGLAFGSSGFGAIKWLGYGVLGWDADTVRSAASVWAVLALAFGVGLAAFLWRCRYKLASWQEVTLLMSATVLLPHVSADYRLVALLLPAAMFVRQAADDDWTRWFYAVVFGLLLISKSYGPALGTASFQVLTNPALLLLLCATIMLRSRTSTAAPAAGASGQEETGRPLFSGHG